MATYSDYQDVKRRKPIEHWHEAIMSGPHRLPPGLRKGPGEPLRVQRIVPERHNQLRYVQGALRAASGGFPGPALTTPSSIDREAAGEALDLLLENDEAEADRGEKSFDKLADFADKSSPGSVTGTPGRVRRERHG